MSALKERLLDPAVRPALVKDCCALIDERVKAIKGFTGVAVKGGYATVKAIKTGFVDGVVDALLDEWVAEMTAFEDEFQRTATAAPQFSAFLVAHRGRVAEALITVTDRRAETTKHKTAASFYYRLRKSAVSHVDEAIPDLVALLVRHGGELTRGA
jgi:hypothetical protein